jgi:hypothetical protein
VLPLYFTRANKALRPHSPVFFHRVAAAFFAIALRLAADSFAVPCLSAFKTA